jgi:hypothetical protein
MQGILVAASDENRVVITAALVDYNLLVAYSVKRAEH